MLEYQARKRDQECDLLVHVHVSSQAIQAWMKSHQETDPQEEVLKLSQNQAEVLVHESLHWKKVRHTLVSGIEKTSISLSKGKYRA